MRSSKIEIFTVGRLVAFVGSVILISTTFTLYRASVPSFWISLLSMLMFIMMIVIMIDIEVDTEVDESRRRC